MSALIEWNPAPKGHLHLPDSAVVRSAFDQLDFEALISQSLELVYASESSSYDKSVEHHDLDRHLVDFFVNLRSLEIS